MSLVEKMIFLQAILPLFLIFFVCKKLNTLTNDSGTLKIHKFGYRSKQYAKIWKYKNHENLVW